MTKFIVTGSMRSGTTFMASLLNSQRSAFCLEDYPWRFFPKRIENKEQFYCFANAIDAKFLYLGLPQPKLANNAKPSDDLIELYIDHLKNIFDCESFGFKRTMMTRKEMAERIEEGFKIIIMKRDIELILKSWVYRIQPDLPDAADKLQRFLKDINYYDPDLPKESFTIVDLELFLADQANSLSRLSEFLDLPLEDVEERYHSFNKRRSVFKDNSSYPFKQNTNTYGDVLENRYNQSDFTKIAKLVASSKYKSSVRQKFMQIVKLAYLKYGN